MDPVFIVVSLLLFWLLAVAGGFTFAAQAAGVLGEKRVDRLLREKLQDGSYWVLKNLELPARGESLQIDHIVVAPTGIFVIETRNYSGWISGSEEEYSWTLESFHKKFRFLNPYRQNLKHVAAVTDFLGCDPRQVQSIVVFAGRGKFRTALPSSVLFLKELVTYIHSHRKSVMSEQEATKYADRLLDWDDSKTMQSQSHAVEVVDLSQGCPECGAEFVSGASERVAANSVEGASLTCANPQCRFRRSLEWSPDDC